MLYIFDKDQTLVMPIAGRKPGSTHPPNNVSEQKFYSDVLPKTTLLLRDGNTLAVASNQGGVAFGIMSGEAAEQLVEHAAGYIGAKAWRVCCCHPKGHYEPFNRDSANRKPNPGMLMEIMEETGFRPEQTVMIGDGEADSGAADAAGCLFWSALSFFERSVDMDASFLLPSPGMHWQGMAFDMQDGLVSRQPLTIPHNSVYMGGRGETAVQVQIVGVSRTPAILLVQTLGISPEFATIGMKTAEALGIA